MCGCCACCPGPLHRLYHYRSVLEDECQAHGAIGRAAGTGMLGNKLNAGWVFCQRHPETVVVARLWEDLLPRSTWILRKNRSPRNIVSTDTTGVIMCPWNISLGESLLEFKCEQYVEWKKIKGKKQRPLNLSPVHCEILSQLNTHQCKTSDLEKK